MQKLKPMEAGGILARLFLRTPVLTRRSLLLVLLLGIDIAVGFALAQAASRSDDPPNVFSLLAGEVLFGFLLPFAALQFGTAVIRDEVETGTLGYLLMRPISRRTLIASRLAAATAATVLVGLATCELNAALFGVSDATWHLGTIAAVVLGGAAYTALFAAVGVVFNRPFLVGILYLLLYELTVSHLPMSARAATIRFHLENMAGVAPRNELLDFLAGDIGVSTSVGVVLGVLVAMVALSLWAFGRREYTTDTNV